MSSKPDPQKRSLQPPRIITSIVTHSPQSSTTLKNQKNGSNQSTKALSPTEIPNLESPSSTDRLSPPEMSSSSLSPSSRSGSSGRSPLSNSITASLPMPIVNPNIRTAIESPSTVRGNPMEDLPMLNSSSAKPKTRPALVTSPSDPLSRLIFSPQAESYTSSGTYFSSETGNSEWSFASSELLTPPLFQGDTDNPPFKPGDQDTTSLKMKQKAGLSDTTPNEQIDMGPAPTRHQRKQKKTRRGVCKRLQTSRCQVAPTAPSGHKHLCKGHVGKYRPRRFDRGNTDTYGRMLPRLPSDPPPPVISRRWSSIESGIHRQRSKLTFPTRPSLSANPAAFRDRRAFCYAAHRRYRSSTFTCGEDHHDIVRNIRKKLTARKVPPSNLSVPTTITLRRASKISSEPESDATTDKSPIKSQETGSDTQYEPNSTTREAKKRRDTLFMVTRRDIDSIVEFVEAKMRRIYHPRSRRSAEAESRTQSSPTKGTVLSPSPTTITPEPQRESVSTVSEADSTVDSTRSPKITNGGIMPYTSVPTVVISEALSASAKAQPDSNLLQVISSTRSGRRGASGSPGSNRSTEIIWEAGALSPGTEDEYIGSPLSAISKSSRLPHRTPSQIVLSDFLQVAHSGRGRRMGVSKSPSDNSTQLASDVSTEQHSRDRTPRTPSQIVMSDFLQVKQKSRRRRNVMSKSPSDKSTCTQLSPDVLSQQQSRGQTPSSTSNSIFSDFLQAADIERSEVGSKSPSVKSRRRISVAEIPTPATGNHYLGEQTSITSSQQGAREEILHHQATTKDTMPQSLAVKSGAFDPTHATESIKDWSWKLPQTEVPVIIVEPESYCSTPNPDDTIPTERLSTSRLQPEPDRRQIRTSFSDSNLSKSSSVKRLRSVRSASSASELLDVISFPPLPRKRTCDWISPLPDIQSSGPNSESTPKSDTKSTENSSTESLHDIGIDATGITIARPLKQDASLANLIKEIPPSPGFIFPLDYHLRRKSTVKSHPKAPARVGLFATLGSSLGSSSGERRKSSTRSPQSPHAHFLDNKNRPSASQHGTWHKARPDSRLPSAAAPFHHSSPAEESQDPLASNRGMRSGRVDRMQLIEDASPPVPKPDHVGIYERITGARWGRKTDEEIERRRPDADVVDSRQPSVDWIG